MLGLVGRIGQALARLCEMRDVDAAREGMDLRMPLALGLVEAVAAGEDDVGALQKPALAARAAPAARREGRQLVHAVIDDALGRQMSGEGPLIGV